MSGSTRQPTTPVHLSPGDRIGAYCIERELGSGGMADVYYAIHDGLRRPAAIKVLRASLAADEVHLQRFMQEARAAASLVHPNIVQVYDVGQDGEHRYIAQEYIPGSNLRQYLSQRTDANEPTPLVATSPTTSQPPHADRQLSVRETLSVLLQVLAALTKSASAGIVHRDIKPENIMLTQDGDVKVADFGLARILLADDPQLTRAGTTLGTPMYMSPEQIQEGQVDIRSDLYSLGVTLYHMLAGRPPFTGETPLALAMQHVQATVPAMSLYRADLPPSMVELISRLLAKSPDQRFSNPSEVLNFLRAHRGDDLSEEWPDQTIPFPGVTISGGKGPMQATLALQSKLRQQVRSSRRNLLSIVASIAFLLTAFGVGAVLAFSTPFKLFESSEEFYADVAKKPSAEEQYRAALLNSDSSSQLTKWEAVGHFFPTIDPAPRINRHYVGLAGLQLARAHVERGESEDARRILRETIVQDRYMGEIIKALAWLQIAAIEQSSGKTKERDDAIDRALKIASEQAELSSGDLPRLDDNVRLMEQAIQDRWFRGRGGMGAE